MITIKKERFFPFFSSYKKLNISASKTGILQLLKTSILSLNESSMKIDFLYFI